MNIFVTVGSQKFQFDRLIKEIDFISSNKDYNFFAQIGYSTYTPHNFEFVKFLDKEEFDSHIDKADLIITHAGTGAIISALKKHKKVIAVPRLSKYGEHVDNHQLQISSVFSMKNYLVEVKDIAKLESEIINITNSEFVYYESNTNFFVKNLIEIIEKL